jgi:hypothetical protein
MEPLERGMEFHKAGTSGALAKIDMRFLSPDKKSRERKTPLKKKV